MNSDNKSRLLIGLINFLQTCKQIKIHRGGLTKYRNLRGWVPKQFVVQGGAKFYREPKTPLDAMIFWKVYFTHIMASNPTRHLPVQCQQYKH